MLNITNLQKKGCLAKEMIRLGVSNDIGEALNAIEDHDLVKSTDDFKVTGNNQEQKVVAVEVEKPKEMPDSHSKRMDEIERKLGMIIEFMNSYKAQNDNNLQEVDARLRDVQSGLRRLENTPKEEVNNFKIEEPDNPAEEPPQKIECKPKGKIEEFKENEKPKEDWNSDDFAVEKIFNNSNSRMTKK